MSIVESLKKLVDPVGARATEAERKSAREQPVREDDGDDPPDDQAPHHCRVCGHVGPEPMFCPECLAGTMVSTRGKHA